MVFRLAGEIIEFLYRLFPPALKRGLIRQGEVFVAVTIRAINADFVWKFAATVVSEGSSLCPDRAQIPRQKRKWSRDVPCRIAQERVPTRSGLGRDKGRDPPLQVVGDPAPYVRGRYQPGIWHETCHEENQGSNS